MLIHKKNKRKKFKDMIPPLESNCKNKKNDEWPPVIQLKGAFFTVFKNV